MILLDNLVLWVHLISAMVLVGGSLFFWLVAIPESYSLQGDEAKRTQFVGRLAKRFGKVVICTFIILIGSGLYNLMRYLGPLGLSAPFPLALSLKLILFSILLLAIFLHNVVYGRRIVRYAREGKIHELQSIRRWSRPVSYANVVLMLLITFLAILL